ncbi:MAG: integration host factor subunit beta [Muribaculaceae bacterium]|nr:integration host factor subunit beta [Muribaculaceae bacterium]
MTRNDIAAALCRKHALTKSTALDVVDTVIKTLADSFVSGESTNLRGFGTFEVKSTAAKKARNISAGTTVIIPAGRTVKFRPCKELKNRMNNGNVD